MLHVKTGQESGSRAVEISQDMQLLTSLENGRVDISASGVSAHLEDMILVYEFHYQRNQ